MQSGIDENIDNNQKLTYLNSINVILSYKETWRLLNNKEAVLKHLKIINEFNIQLKSSIGYDLLSCEKKKLFVQTLVDFLNNSYEYIKENISKFNLIIQESELYDYTGRFPGL